MAKVEFVGPGRTIRAAGRIGLDLIGVRDAVRTYKATRPVVLPRRGFERHHARAWAGAYGNAVGLAHTFFPVAAKRVSYWVAEDSPRARSIPTLVGAVALDFARTGVSLVNPTLFFPLLTLAHAAVGIPSGIAAEVQDGGRRRFLSGTLPQ